MAKLRGRGAGGYIPSPLDIINLRGDIIQAEAAKMIYVTQTRFSNYESGLARMHPAYWELLKIKIERLKND